MNRSSHMRLMFCIAASAFAVSGCVSVPEVESRLQSWQIGPNTYIAGAGDSLDSVAFRYRLQPQDLIAMNPHLTGGIVAGDRVVVHQFDARGANDGYQSSGQSIGSTISSGSINRTPVTVQPRTVQPRGDNSAGNLPEALTYPTATVPTPEGVVAFDQIREFPANARNTGNAALPIEEIVPDELDEKLTYAPLVSVNEERLAAADLSGNTLIAPRNNSVSGWVWPTFGEVAREFAPSEAGGQGIDIAGVPGQEIHAASGGTVAYAGRDLSGGSSKLIILRHHNGLMTTYSHADQLFVAEDDVVRAGDVIASLGSNARNESVLRFEVRQDGNPLNPMNFLTN